MLLIIIISYLMKKLKMILIFYYILDGQSLQWSLPPQILGIFNDFLSVKTELFASPSNHYLSNHYSLFYVDKQFGAIDNFFNLKSENMLEGTYEINPPFIEKIF